MSRRPLQLFVLVGVSGIFSLLLLELAVRIVAPQAPSWLAIYRRHPVLPFHALQPNARAVVDTGETHWSVFTDDGGFRVDEKPSSPSSCTALWLGDSFAFGHGVDFGESFVGLVGQGAPGVRSVDTAVPGYGPVQYRQILEYQLRPGEPAPDFVYVAIFVGNDFHDTLWDKDVQVHEGVLGHAGDLRSYLKTHAQLYRLVSNVYHRFAPADDPYAQVREELADPAAWAGDFLSRASETFTREIERMQELGSEHGVPVRFVVLPTEDAVRAARAGEGRSGEGEAGALLPVLKARAILAAAGADFVDATGALARSGEEALYLPFDGHFTRAGNRIVADAILEAWPLACSVGRAP